MLTLSGSSYPFEFVGISEAGADDYQTDTLVYLFKSSKSARVYEVHVERYLEHLCCVKFFDTSGTQGFGRFSQTTATFEPRSIFRTVADIALDALLRDPLASFCFVGAADSRDILDGSQTRRYRVYKAYVSRLGLDQQFETVFLDEYSLVLLVNKKAQTAVADYTEKISSFL